jgi:hypothetical protein
MTAAPVQTEKWSHKRLWTTIALMFGVQVALIFRLRDQPPPTPAPRPAGGPSICMSDATPGELLGVEDPTLFVLPHEQSFSGAFWMRTPSPQIRVESPPEPLAWLSITGQQFGADFARFIQTNSTGTFQTIAKIEPNLIVPELPPATPISSPSTLRIEGDLARRRLLSKVELPPQESRDLLTNSLIRLAVDAQGNTLSALPFQPGCGSTNADQLALQIARNARFESIEPDGTGRNRKPKTAVTFGTMIFEWQTVLPSNEPSASSPP